MLIYKVGSGFINAQLNMCPILLSVFLKTTIVSHPLLVFKCKRQILSTYTRKSETETLCYMILITAD